MELLAFAMMNVYLLLAYQGRVVCPPRNVRLTVPEINMDLAFTSTGMVLEYDFVMLVANFVKLSGFAVQAGLALIVRWTMMHTQNQLS